MKILVLHRVPYPRIDYARGIDHDLHDVTYFGKRDILDTIPVQLRCTRVERAGLASAFDEASAWLDAHPCRFDVVISLSAEAAAAFDPPPTGLIIEHWEIDDPTENEGNRDAQLDAYRYVRTALEKRIAARFSAESGKMP